MPDRRIDPADQQRLARELERGFEMYMTREEVMLALKEFRTDLKDEIAKDITAAELRWRNWILASVLAIIFTLGSGLVATYVSITSQLGAVGTTVEILEGRRDWMQRSDQRDTMQDQALQEAVPKYEPMPYVPAPR